MSRKRRQTNLKVGQRVRVAIPTLTRIGQRLLLDGTALEEIGTVLRFYKTGMKTGPTIVNFQMDDRVLVGMSTWIVGPADVDTPTQLDLFGAAS